MNLYTFILPIFTLVGLCLTLEPDHPLGARRSCKFDCVRLCDHFVDKTDIINVIFNELASTRNIFISNAHGFGSSLNLALIDMFANEEYTLDRQPIHPENSYSYSVLKENNFKISQHQSLFDEHLGKYIVVPLRLRRYMQDEILPKHVAWSLNMMISWSNRRWRWVGFNTKNFTKGDNETSQRDFSFLQKVTRTKFKLWEITTAVERYVEILHRYFNKKVIILVDDYDRIFRHAIQHSLKNIDFYYSFMNKVLLPVLQDSERVHKVIITGTTTLPLYLGNCSLAPLVEKYTFLQDHPFTPFFGFDDQEVDDLFAKFHISLDDKHELEDYAGGYKTLTSYTNKFNSDLVMSYFRRRRNLVDDLVFNGTTAKKSPEDEELYFPTPFLMVPPFRYRIVELLHKLDIEFHLVEYNETIFARFADFTVYNYPNKDTFDLDLLFTYIFDQGYLRPTNVANKYHIPHRAALNETWTAMKIYYNDLGQPALQNIALDFKKILLSENSSQIDSIKQELQTKLNTYFKQLTDKEHFETLRVPEYHFHSIVYAALASSEGLYLNENELDAFGKSYIQFSTPISTTKGIIEIKYGESAEQALELALSSFISDTQLNEIKYIGINIDQHIDTSILVQLKPIQEHEQNPYQRK